MRINQWLARAGFGSRRECESYVREGRVELNGILVRELHVRVDPGDQVLVDGKAASLPTALRYIMLNKPPGYVVSRRDFKNDPIIYQLLPREMQNLKYAGRLDRDSRGIVLLSDDGDFIQAATHPSKRIPKYYRVRARPLPAEHTLREKFTRGIADQGELLRAREIEVLDRARGLVRVVLMEGRNRQLRRMFSAIGATVEDLYRFRVGRLNLDESDPGEGRFAEFRPEDILPSIWPAPRGRD